MNLDPDGTLPVERTALAWGRTLLGLAGVLGPAAANAIVTDRPPAAITFAVLAVVSIALSWSVGRRRATAIAAAERRLDSPGSTIVIAVVVVAVSLVVLVGFLF